MSLTDEIDRGLRNAGGGQSSAADSQKQFGDKWLEDARAHFHGHLRDVAQLCYENTHLRNALSQLAQSDSPDMFEDNTVLQERAGTELTEKQSFEPTNPNPVEHLLEGSVERPSFSLHLLEGSVDQPKASLGLDLPRSREGQNNVKLPPPSSFSYDMEHDDEDDEDDHSNAESSTEQSSPSPGRSEAAYPEHSESACPQLAEPACPEHTEPASQETVVMKAGLSKGASGESLPYVSVGSQQFAMQPSRKSTASLSFCSSRSRRSVLSKRNKAVFCVHPIYQSGNRMKSIGSLHSKSSTKSWRSHIFQQSKRPSLSSSAGESDDIEVDIPMLMIMPGSGIRLIWDTMTIMCMAHDLIVVPLQLSFDVKWNLFDISSWMIRVFWSFDMFVAARTGYFKNGRVVMDPRRVLKRYLTGWFPFDLLVVGMDWFFWVFAESSAQRLSRAGKFLRIFRFFRMLRLFRIVKVRNAFAHIMEHILNEVTRTQFIAVKLFAMILLINHLIACGWNLIGAMPGSSFPSWIQRAEHLTEEHNGLDRYLVAFHWALSNFGVGSTTITPLAQAENVYAIAVMVFALLSVSSLVSTVTNCYAQLHQIRSEEEQNFRQLRKYFRQHDISADLCARAHKYISQYQEVHRERLKPQDVAYFSLLSKNLQAECQYNIYESYLNEHRTFVWISEFSKPVMLNICSQALSTLFLASGDLAFRAGEVAMRTYYIPGRDTDLQYVTKVNGEHLKTKVKTHCWICEVAMWCDWIHAGGLRILQDACELVAVDSSSFGSLIEKNWELQDMVSEYARDFVDELNTDIENAMRAHGGSSNPSTPFAQLGSGSAESRTIMRTNSGAFYDPDVAEVAMKFDLYRVLYSDEEWATRLQRNTSKYGILLKWWSRFIHRIL